MQMPMTRGLGEGCFRKSQKHKVCRAALGPAFGSTLEISGSFSHIAMGNSECPDVTEEEIREFMRHRSGML